MSICLPPLRVGPQASSGTASTSRGAATRRARSGVCRRKTEAESERSYRDFEEYVKFIKGQPGVRFVTAGDLMRLYADRAAERGFDRAALLALARDVQREISFRQLDGVSLSGADAFWLLTAALDAYLEEKELPAAVRLRTIYGPARPFAPGPMPRPEAIGWADFARAARDVAAFCRERGRMPDEVLGRRSEPCPGSTSSPRSARPWKRCSRRAARPSGSRSARGR